MLKFAAKSIIHEKGYFSRRLWGQSGDTEYKCFGAKQLVVDYQDVLFIQYFQSVSSMRNISDTATDAVLHHFEARPIAFANRPVQGSSRPHDQKKQRRARQPPMTP